MLRSFATVDFGLQEMAATAMAPEMTDGKSHRSEGVPDVSISERSTTLAKWTLAVAAVAAAIVAAIATVQYQQATSERPVAKITGLIGPLQWTGDGGRVFHNLSVGTELPGGTVEGMTPGSWFELEFRDGSTVTLTGNSMLTFSDRGQKELHLKAGNLSCNADTSTAGPTNAHLHSFRNARNSGDAVRGRSGTRQYDAQRQRGESTGETVQRWQHGRCHGETPCDRRCRSRNGSGTSSRSGQLVDESIAPGACRRTWQVVAGDGDPRCET